MKKEDKFQMRRQRGFSLIELLIVVAIILIIAAIAIPNLLRAKMAANESSAVGSIRTINTAEITYSSSYPTVGYAATLANLGGASPCTPGPATGCLIDSVLSGGNKSGYNFANRHPQLLFLRGCSDSRGPNRRGDGQRSRLPGLATTALSSSPSAPLLPWVSSAEVL
jgi:prepilin-type N-terminal cleavage/methylation domain-containing protein